MGTIARGKLPHLIEDLLANPSAYGVFQALRLIETNCGNEPATGGETQGFIDLAPAAEMTFPAGEIRHCRVDENARYRLELNFMGFYGIDSPLPQFFNDIAAFDTPRGAELRAFLELFNKRLYQLLYDAWKKMNLHGAGDNQASVYCRHLEALYGRDGTGSFSGRLDYAGILATRVKNSQSLADMLKDFLRCPVCVKQNVPCWIDLEETATPGGGFVLGDSAMLGSRLMDVNSKIRISIGPLPDRDATDLLPGRSAALTLSAMIREYLDPTLQYDLELLIQPDAGSESMLGDDQAVLGWTACLGRAEDDVHRVCLTGDSLDGWRELAKC